MIGFAGKLVHEFLDEISVAALNPVEALFPDLRVAAVPHRRQASSEAGESLFFVRRGMAAHTL